MSDLDLKRGWRTLAERLSRGITAKWVAFGAIALVLVEWGVTGITVIHEDEQGVVVRFGEVARVAPAGILFTLPWPIEKIIAVKTTEVRTMSVGYKMVDAVRGIAPAPEEVEWVSGDTNIFDLTLTIKYAVKDPVDYLFRVGRGEADFLVRRCAEASLTKLVATMQIDEILTRGKTRIQDETRVRTQEALDALEAGIRIVAVNIGEVVPPEKVIEAFNDVSTARLENAKMLNEADGYAKDLIPRARAAANRMVQEAEIYRSETVNRAHGETARFLELLAEANQAREITEVRLYLEGMERILPKARKIIVEDDERNTVRLLE